MLPLLLGAGGSLVGGGMGLYGAINSRNAMTRAYQRELNRQQAYQQQATPIFEANVAASGYPAAQGDLQYNQGVREGAYGGVQNVPLSMSPGPENQLNLSRDAANYQQTGKARAALGSYGDWQQGMNERNFNTNQQLGNISSFARGEAQNVYPYEMYDAQHSGDSWRFWGQLLQGLGMAGSNMASLGSSPPPEGGGRAPTPLAGTGWIQ